MAAHRAADGAHRARHHFRIEPFRRQQAGAARHTGTAPSRNMLRNSQAMSTRAGGTKAWPAGAGTLAAGASGPLRARTKNPAPRRDCTRPRATSRS